MAQDRECPAERSEWGVSFGIHTSLKRIMTRSARQSPPHEDEGDLGGDHNTQTVAEPNDRKLGAKNQPALISSRAFASADSPIDSPAKSLAISATRSSPTNSRT